MNHIVTKPGKWKCALRACFRINRQLWDAKKRKRKVNDGWPTNKEIVENITPQDFWNTHPVCEEEVSITKYATLGVASTLNR